QQREKTDAVPRARLPFVSLRCSKLNKLMSDSFHRKVLLGGGDSSADIGKLECDELRLLITKTSGFCATFYSVRDTSFFFHDALFSLKNVKFIYHKAVNVALHLQRYFIRFYSYLFHIQQRTT